MVLEIDKHSDRFGKSGIAKNNPTNQYYNPWKTPFFTFHIATSQGSWVLKEKNSNSEIISIYLNSWVIVRCI